MNDIDFLPQDYVCVQEKRSKSNWLRGLLVVVLALIATGWGAQRQSMMELAARRNRMRDQATNLLSKLDSADVLKAELGRLESEGRLIDALRSKVPPSRWLEAIVGALPPQTVLLEIRSQIDEGSVPVARPEPGGAAPKPNEIKTTDPVEQDLQRLIKLVPRESVTISIRGTAVDDLEVSQFLNALHQNNLFEHVQLLFTDQQVRKDHSVRSFAIRLRTQPLAGRFGEQKSGPNSTSRAVAVRP
jgi:hypothetical protein